VLSKRPYFIMVLSLVIANFAYFDVRVDYEDVSKSFRTESLPKCTLTFCTPVTNGSSRSRRPVRKLLDTPSYVTFGRLALLLRFREVPSSGLFPESLCL
jgi:hypothetical protein